MGTLTDDITTHPVTPSGDPETMSPFCGEIPNDVILWLDNKT